jgi:hypothetical protein
MADNSLLQNRENPVNTSNGGLKTSVSFTRPSDTTAYTPGEVVGTSPATNLIFSGISNILEGSIFITGVSLKIDSSSTFSGMGVFRLHLYDTAPTAIADNATFDLIVADRSKYLGFIEIATPSKLGSTNWGETNSIMKQIKLASQSNTIYGILATNAAYTPNASDVYKITLYTIGA